MYERNLEMSKENRIITPQMRWILTGITSVLLLISIVLSSHAGVFAQAWGKEPPIYVLETISYFLEYITPFKNPEPSIDSVIAGLSFMLSGVFAYPTSWAWEEYDSSFPKNKYYL